MLVACEGEWDSIRLRVPKRGWGRDRQWAWAPDVRGRESEIRVPMFFLHTTHCLSVFDLVVGAASGRHCVLRLGAEY